MKYNININQRKSVEWGLTSSEAIVFSWIYELASWADKIEYKNKTYYYGSKNKACEELPIISNKRDTMYRLFKSLQEKGLVELITLDKSDYLALTNKGKEWHDNNYSEKNPSFGNKSKETECNPTNNKTIKEKDNIKEDTIVSKKDGDCSERAADKQNVIDYSLIKDKWEEICPMLSSVRELNPKRKKAIANTLKNNKATADDMFKCFKIIAASEFCKGNNSQHWKATFDWIINDTKSCFNRLLEGEFSKSKVEHDLYEKIIKDTPLEESKKDNLIIDGVIYK